MTDPKQFGATDAEFRELARQVQADAEDADKQNKPSAESLAEGVE